MAKRDETGKYQPKGGRTMRDMDDSMERDRTKNARRAPSRDRDGEQGGNDPGMAGPIRLRDVKDGENLGDYSQSAGVGVAAYGRKVELENHGNANYAGPFKPMVGAENLLSESDDEDDEDMNGPGVA